MTTPIPFGSRRQSLPLSLALAGHEFAPAPLARPERRTQIDRRLASDRRTRVDRRREVISHHETLSDLGIAFSVGLAIAVVWMVGLNLMEADRLRAGAALLAVSAFIYPAAALRAGHLGAFIVSSLVVAGFFSLGLLSLQHGMALLVLGFGLHATWGLLQGLTTLERLAPTLGWAGLQFGSAVLLVAS